MPKIINNYTPRDLSRTAPRQKSPARYTIPDTTPVSIRPARAAHCCYSPVQARSGSSCPSSVASSRQSCEYYTHHRPNNSSFTLIITRNKCTDIFQSYHVQSSYRAEPRRRRPRRRRISRAPACPNSNTVFSYITTRP